MRTVRQDKKELDMGHVILLETLADAATAFKNSVYFDAVAPDAVNEVIAYFYGNADGEKTVDDLMFDWATSIGDDPSDYGL